MYILSLVQFSSVQWLSHVQLFATPWTAARQASLCITNSQSLLKLMCIESVMPSSHLILCLPLLLPPPIPPSIRVFSNESALHMRWPKYWSFSFSISPSKVPGYLYAIMVKLRGCERTVWLERLKYIYYLIFYRYHWLISGLENYYFSIWKGWY